jgi:hypothetical protein
MRKVLTLTFLIAVVMIGNVFSQSVDGNDTFETANQVQFGEGYTPTLNPSNDDIDWYYFETSQKGMLNVSFNSAVDASIAIYQGEINGQHNILTETVVGNNDLFEAEILADKCPLGPIYLFVALNETGEDQDFDYYFNFTFEENGNDCSTVESPSITLNAPEDHITAVPGEFVYLSWSGFDGNDPNATVSIGYDENTTVYDGFSIIAENLPVSDGYNWQIPNDIPNGIYNFVAFIENSEDDDFHFTVDFIVDYNDGGGSGTAGTDLVAYYNFNEGSGNVLTDVSGSEFQHDADIYNDPDWVTGIGGTGSALRLNGVNQYIEIPIHDDFLFQNQSVTFSAWVQIDDNNNNGNTFIGLYDATDVRPRIQLIKRRSGSSSGRYNMQIQPATQEYDAFSDVTGDVLSKGEWTYLVGVVDYDTREVKLYVNGQLQDVVGSNVADFDIGSSTNPRLLIGSNTNPGSFHNSLIDEVKIYGRALTEEEIIDEYNINENNDLIRLLSIDNFPNILNKGVSYTVNRIIENFSIPSIQVVNVRYYLRASTEQPYTDLPVTDILISEENNSFIPNVIDNRSFDINLPDAPLVGFYTNRGLYYWQVVIDEENQYGDPIKDNNVIISNEDVVFESSSELQISDITFSPEPISSDGYTSILINIRNIGSDLFIGKEVKITTDIIDISGEGGFDSFWLSMLGGETQIRQSKSFNYPLPNLSPGQSEQMSFEFNFKVPDYSDRLEINVRNSNYKELLDDMAYNISRSIPINVEFGTEAGSNCLDELILATKLSPISKSSAIPQAASCMKSLYDYGQEFLDIPDDLSGIDDNYIVLKEGFRDHDLEKIVDGGKNAADDALSLYKSFKNIIQVIDGDIGLPNECIELDIVTNPLDIFLGLIESAWHELVSYRGCGAWLAHNTNELSAYIRGNLESFCSFENSNGIWNDYDPSWIVIACPINLEIIDQDGNISSYQNNIVTNNISNTKLLSCGDSIVVAILDGNKKYEFNITSQIPSYINVYTGSINIEKYIDLGIERNGFNRFKNLKEYFLDNGETLSLSFLNKNFENLVLKIDEGDLVESLNWDTVYFSPSTLDTGSINGIVSQSGTGSHGVLVDLFNEGGELVASVYTDDNGQYNFPSLDNGTYNVAITPPLGFSCENEVQEIVVRGLPHEINFELEEGESSGPEHVWWWKIYLEELRNDSPRPNQFTEAEINEWLENLYNHFYSRTDGYGIQIEYVTYAGSPALPMTYEDLAYTLLDCHESTYEAITRRQLLTNMLNVASGKMMQTDEISADGAILSQAITYFHQVYQNNKAESSFEERNNLIQASLNLRMISMGQMLPAGAVPLTTPKVVYKGTDTENENLVPTSFSLSQNYPNPFNPTTTIAFSLPEASDIHLEIYNLLGQKVDDISGNYEAGDHLVYWDSRGLASGIYLYRLTAGNNVETKKMTLLK